MGTREQKDPHEGKVGLQTASDHKAMRPGLFVRCVNEWASEGCKGWSTEVAVLCQHIVGPEAGVESDTHTHAGGS